jgi:hypothetical protein
MHSGQRIVTAHREKIISQDTLLAPILAALVSVVWAVCNAESLTIPAVNRGYQPLILVLTVIADEKPEKLAKNQALNVDESERTGCRFGCFPTRS